jgi:hypothetical protein
MVRVTLGTDLPYRSIAVTTTLAPALVVRHGRQALLGVFAAPEYLAVKT